MRDLVRAAADVQKFLDKKRWKYCFIGGLAVQKWGQLRVTQDIDLTVFTCIGNDPRSLVTKRKDAKMQRRKVAKAQRLSSLRLCLFASLRFNRDLDDRDRDVQNDLSFKTLHHWLLEDMHMPFDDEIPPYGDLAEVSEELNELSRKIIGAAIEVHRHLGPGLPEEAYQRAMEIEMSYRRIPFERQKYVQILYKGVPVAAQRLDLLADGKLVVELKSCAALGAIDRLQTRTYIRIIHQPLGLLINFNVPVLKEGIRRVIDSMIS